MTLSAHARPSLRTTSRQTRLTVAAGPRAARLVIQPPQPATVHIAMGGGPKRVTQDGDATVAHSGL
jgi:hypothetical protein